MRTVAGSRSQMTPLTITLVRMPCFCAIASSRWMPRTRPNEAHECALVSKKTMLVSTSAGVMRFDGVRTVQWRPPAGEALPDERVRTLLGASDGSLWIGAGKLAENNAQQVTQVRKILEGLGLEIASPDEARAILGLKGLDQVGW